MSDTNTEIELKLALVKGSLARTRRAIGDVHLEETAIEDVYFDTPDASLRRRGLVLRLRRDGDRWMQTLKAASNGHSVVPVRGEWEVALPARKSAPALDLERFEITPLRALLRAAPDHLEAQAELGRTLRAAGRCEEACDAYAALVERLARGGALRPEERGVE